MVRWLLLNGVDPEEASLLLVARALRALGDGYMAVLLPAYLLAIGRPRSGSHTSDCHTDGRRSRLTGALESVGSCVEL